MSSYPFTLKGTQHDFSGSGSSEGEVEATATFHLGQGALVYNVTECPDDFLLVFRPSEGNIVPVTEKIADGIDGISRGLAAISGNIAGRFRSSRREIKRRFRSAAEAAERLITNTIGVRTFSCTERGHGILAVDKDNAEGLRTGNHRLEVYSTGRWECKILQPSLGQSDCSLVDGFEDEEWREGVPMLMGPYLTGSRPMLANIQHRGGGAFRIEALSVDGTHQCSVYSEAGQFTIEDHQTELKPGKEYMFDVTTDGDWKLKFSEGY